MSLRSLFPLLTGLAVSFVLPLSVAVAHPCSSVAIASRTYGTNGSDGTSGRSGRDGTSGADRTVNASEQFLQLDLRGNDGRDGEQGERGGRARCQNHNQPDNDVRAASGGDGGRGGSGGDGGDGGNVTVYFANRSHLQNVSINAAGGEGGRGASGGVGGQGCNCHDYQWSQTRCENGSCETKNFSCRDGSDGSDGSFGGRGEEGRVGTARIIDQTLLSGERLAEDNPVVVQAISSLANNPVNLSRNLWQAHEGAQSLFNSNSVVDDSYEAYVGRVEKQFQLVWEDNYPQASVQSSGDLNLSIDNRGEIQIETPEELWIDSEQMEENNVTVYRVKYALLASDAVNLSIGRNDGRGEQFSINVVDLAGKSELIETQFQVRYKTKSEGRRGRYITRYEGLLPNELLSRDYNRFILNIGQLPIDKDYLESGTEAKLEIIVTRTLADNEAEHVLSWNGEL